MFIASNNNVNAAYSKYSNPLDGIKPDVDTAQHNTIMQIQIYQQNLLPRIRYLPRQAPALQGHIL